jgi:hypothetical protein
MQADIGNYPASTPLEDKYVSIVQPCMKHQAKNGSFALKQDGTQFAVLQIGLIQESQLRSDWSY